ncbi:TonB-linked outer membrane protein, SusC/RagA family [Chitinophaga sp. CF118]|uniref:SusC/RagA family TonB-linked outer membrane protein n=1 Tax=Chitinophaga sp. CF118 TaxID=1884367 RepID=UPI0008E7E34B|nr:TonB-dependent receptor [Chitinophaga sp. CF118]SFD98273.1 TonB-linked outer membrane protein, SusC/RagA family [Chitinophaga sp. CF118]
MKTTEKLKGKMNSVRLLIGKPLTLILFIASLLTMPILSFAQDTKDTMKVRVRFTQDKTIRGRVTLDNNDPVIGASVMIKGSKKGTTTNNNGEFSIAAPKGAVLVISSIGYSNAETTVGDATTINVKLTSSATDMGEVVVVGYGTQKKKDLTGAVASVNLEALTGAPNTNIAQFLQGTVPGLNVGMATTAGGTPPISIRGRVTLNGNQNVLIILDGIQYTGSLSSINPDDIASIDVLKDASSTAVYGAQAANGVILITSRRGQLNQKPRISFSTAYTTQYPTIGNLKPYDRDGYLSYLREAFYDKAYLGPNYTEPNPDFKIEDVADNSIRDAQGKLRPNNYNWFDEGTNPGAIVENYLSISGGGDNVTYLLSGGLVDQKGFIMNDKFKRKSIRANIETRPLSWWKVGLLSSAAFVNQDGAEPSFGSLQRMTPLIVPYDSTGKLIPFPMNTLEPNPFTTYYVDDYDRNNYYFANIYTDIDFPFLKGLNYRMNFGNNYRLSKHYFSSIYDAGQTGRAYKQSQNYYDYTFDNILTYTKKLGKHDITATLLYGAIERQSEDIFSEATGFSRLTLSYNNLSQGANQFSRSDAWKEALAYQMVRVNYKFNDRYLLTATLRRDGFSGFAKNYKYATFPVLALGWILTEERFMKKIKGLDYLKIRAGYGVNGNQTSRYTSIARVTNSAAYVYGDGGTTAFGQQVSSLGNDDLKWERTKGMNVGTDFTLFNNKLTGSLDYYRNNTYDLLYSVAIPAVTGFGNIMTNLGQIRNTGFEAALTYNVVKTKNVNWSATFNFSTNKNQIISLTGVDANKDGKEDDLISSGLFIGKSISAIYDYKLDGINQLNDTRIPGFPVGSVKIVDQNKDNDITQQTDRVFLGRQEPAYRMSLFQTFSYKALTLSIFLNSVQGGKDGYLGNNNPSFFREDNSIRVNNLQGIDFWSPRNPTGKYPRNISGSHAKIEPNMYQDRSFVRLQDVSLSYNLATGLLKRFKAQTINLYVSGKNLYTWTNWEGWDPEANAADGTPLGLVIGGRPVLRGFTVGLNIIY